MLSALPANAQATRTWVSQASGDDAFACSRTQPCRTFAGAIAKTAINGEINCIDAGGYGAVTIAKSVTIDCTGTYGSILANAITCASVALRCWPPTISMRPVDGRATASKAVRPRCGDIASSCRSSTTKSR